MKVTTYIKTSVAAAAVALTLPATAQQTNAAAEQPVRISVKIDSAAVTMGGRTNMQVEGLDSVEALRAVQAGSEIAVAIATLSVWLFLTCRAILALGEAGNFPAAIKVTAEYFPKKDRAFSTSIFNSGASIGALAAPLTIPVLAKAYGWEMSFIIIGAIGFVWMFFWHFIYDKPQNSKHVNEAELAYINQDEQQEEKTVKEEQKDERVIPFLKCFTYRQTWSFIAGKFFTDGVWWFYLFWAPAYFSDQFGYKRKSMIKTSVVVPTTSLPTLLLFVVHSAPIRARWYSALAGPMAIRMLSSSASRLPRLVTLPIL